MRLFHVVFFLLQICKSINQNSLVFILRFIKSATDDFSDIFSIYTILEGITSASRNSRVRSRRKQNPSAQLTLFDTRLDRFEVQSQRTKTAWQFDMSSVQARYPRRTRWPRRTVARVISRRRCPRDSVLVLTPRHREPPSPGLPQSGRNSPAWSSRGSRLPSRHSIGKNLVVPARSMQYAAGTVPPTSRPRHRITKVYWVATPGCRTTAGRTTLFASPAWPTERRTSSASRETPRS